MNCFSTLCMIVMTMSCAVCYCYHVTNNRVVVIFRFDYDANVEIGEHKHGQSNKYDIQADDVK